MLPVPQQGVGVPAAPQPPLPVTAALDFSHFHRCVLISHCFNFQLPFDLWWWISSVSFHSLFLFFFWSALSDLLSGTRCSRLTFSLFQPLNQPFLQGSCFFFIGEWYLEIKIGVRGCLLLLGCHCFQVFSVDRTKKSMHMHRTLYISVSPCVHILIDMSPHWPRDSNSASQHSF